MKVVGMVKLSNVEMKRGRKIEFDRLAAYWRVFMVQKFNT